jgi:hypothetical protein
MNPEICLFRSLWEAEKEVRCGAGYRKDGVIESRYWVPGDTGRYDCADKRVSDERLPGRSSWISSFMLLLTLS